MVPIVDKFSDQTLCISPLNANSNRQDDQKKISIKKCFTLATNFRPMNGWGRRL